MLTALEIGAIGKSDSLTLTSQLIEIRKILYGLLRHLASRTKTPT